MYLWGKRLWRRSYPSAGDNPIAMQVRFDQLQSGYVKGFLVAGYFMHLISEKKMIYGILIATVFFFTGLMFLTVWSMDHNSLIHMSTNVP